MAQTTKKLTEKQKRFIDHYIITANATEAARLAGYKQPHVKGAQTLAIVREQVDARLAAIESERIASATEVMQYLTAVMRGEMTEEVPLLSGDGMQQLTEKDTAVRDRLKAAELIGKRYGMFTDKIGIDGAVPVIITGEDSLAE